MGKKYPLARTDSKENISSHLRPHGSKDMGEKQPPLIWLWKVLSRSVVFDSLRPCRPWPARLPCPWVSQARILDWVAITFSRGSSWPRDQTRVSCIKGRFFTIWATRKVCALTQGVEIRQETAKFQMKQKLGEGSEKRLRMWGYPWRQIIKTRGW